MMSMSEWDLSLASAEGLLTCNERSLLLEVDLFKHNDDDLLKNFSGAETKIDPSIFNEDANSLYPPSPFEAKPSRAELANDLLQQLETQCKQENIFSNWLEEKAELPIFENISQIPERVEVTQAPIPASYQPVAPQPTEDLLREFESVYGAVELTHLTPPQSPPGPATQLLLSYAQQAQGTVVFPQEQWQLPQVPAVVPDLEAQALEDLVRHRAAQLTSPLASGDNATPTSSPPSSPRSCSTDDDWSSSGRSKPYSRHPEDRRTRKKEQNKNAATRYRQKKKAEVEVLLNEERALRQRHVQLDDKCSDLQREIRYLKGLMRDLFKAKGLIK